MFITLAKNKVLVTFSKVFYDTSSNFTMCCLAHVICHRLDSANLSTYWYLFLTIEPSVTEHASLGDNMFPSSWSSESLQFIIKHLSHEKDPVCHHAYILFPK